MGLILVKSAMGIFLSNIRAAILLSIAPLTLLVGMSLLRHQGAAWLGISQIPIFGEFSVQDAVSLIAVFTSLGWLALRWHQHVLGGEQNDPSSKVCLRDFVKYVGFIVFFNALVAIVFSLVGLALTAVGSIQYLKNLHIQSSYVALFLVWLAVIVPPVMVLYLWFRLSIGLPAVLDERPLDPIQIWRQTSQLQWAALRLSIWAVLLTNGVAGLVSLSFVLSPVLGTVLAMISAWFVVMLVLSATIALYRRSVTPPI